MSTQDSAVRFHHRPAPFTLDAVRASPVTGLLMTGIVNPFGPTVHAVVAVGRVRAGADLPLVRLLLNPFAQEVEEVGRLAVGRTWRPAAVVRSVLGFRSGSCPTLLVSLADLKPGAAARVFGEYLSGFADARRVYDRVRAYPGDPWKRVSHEMRTATGRMGVGNAGVEAADPLTEAEARGFAEVLLTDAHAGPEVEALAAAWRGSIRHVAPDLESLPGHEMAGLYEHLGRACRLPPSPQMSPWPLSEEEMAALVGPMERGGTMPSLNDLLAAFGAVADGEPPAPKRREK